MGAGGHPLVLVVDDEPAIRLVCRVNLELEGYGVLEADDTASALAALAQEPVALAVLDLRLMRGERGLALAERIRSEWPDVAIVTMSGTVPIPPDVLETADAALTKPFVVDDFVSTVKRLRPRTS